MDENKNELSQINEDDRVAGGATDDNTGGKLIQVQLANGNWINIGENYSEFPSKNDAASMANDLGGLVPCPPHMHPPGCCKGGHHKHKCGLGKMQFPPMLAAKSCQDE